MLVYILARGEKKVAYLSLYRAWRPKKFHDLIGQDHITRTLVNALTRDKLSHAYLFCGPRGTGKTTTAKILARAVNCEDLSRGEPCGRCPSCLEVMEGRGVDVLEIDAASNRGIDEIRDLREKVRYAPARLDVKVYIIDEVHMLTPEAFNALLKTLEEPPTRVLFILATTEPNKLPATILSRCQRFDFFPLEVQAIASYLAMVAEREGRTAGRESLLALARAAGGGMRDALSLLEQALVFSEDELQEEDVLQVLGQAGWQYFLDLAEKIAAAHGTAALNIVDSLVREGKDITQFARDLLAFFRDLTLARMSPEDDRLLAGYTGERRQALGEKALLFSSEGLVALIEEINTIIGEMKWSEQPRLILEVGLLRMCHLPPRLTLAGALERITALEERMLQLSSREQPIPAIQGKPPVSGGLKKKASGKIERKTEDAAPPPEGSPEAEEDAGGEASAFSLEEGTRAWRDVLKRVRREKPMLASLVKDSYVADVGKGLLVLAFKKNGEFNTGMLERRRADKAFLEYQLKKLLEREITIKFTARTHEGEAAADPLTRDGPEGEAPPPEEEPAQEEKGSQEDLLVESARDIFNGNIIE